MNKTEFLQTLEQALIDLHIEDKTDILYDYEEHFRIGAENGKTDDELITELGNPVSIARQYITVPPVQTIKATPNSNAASYQKEKPYSDESSAKADDFELQKKTALNQIPGQRPVFVSFIAACGMGLFNLIFVLGPYLGFVGAIIGLFAGAIGLTIGGAAMVLGPVISPLVPEFMSIMNSFSTALMMSLGVGTTALGLLSIIGMCYVVKYFCIITVKYIKWNIKIIK